MRPRYLRRFPHSLEPTTTAAAAPAAAAGASPPPPSGILPPAWRGIDDDVRSDADFALFLHASGDASDVLGGGVARGELARILAARWRAAGYGQPEAAAALAAAPPLAQRPTFADFCAWLRLVEPPAAAAGGGSALPALALPGLPTLPRSGSGNQWTRSAVVAPPAVALPSSETTPSRRPLQQPLPPLPPRRPSVGLASPLQVLASPPDDINNYNNNSSVFSGSDDNDNNSNNNNAGGGDGSSAGATMSAALLRAAGHHGWDAVARLLERGAAPDGARERNGWTALHHACAAGAVVAAALLLSRGAALGRAGDDGRTPLHRACAVGAARLVRAMLGHPEFGAALDAVDAEGQTALHCAARGAHPAVVDILCEAGADVDARTHAHRAALHLAASSGAVGGLDSAPTSPWDSAAAATTAPAASDVGGRAPGNAAACVSTLLLFGASPRVTDVFWATPLHSACEVGAVDVIRALLQPPARQLQLAVGARRRSNGPLGSGANTRRSQEQHGAAVDAGDERGRTPLFVAAAAGHAEAARLLLALGGADPNATTTVAAHARAPLHAAVIAGAVAVVEVLLAGGANASLGDRKGWTALHHCARHGQAALVHVIAAAARPVGAGATKLVDEPAFDDGDATPLHVAAEHGRGDVLCALLRNGASPSAVDDDDRTPLHRAAAAADAGMSAVAALVDAGADPLAADHVGTTPLHDAAQHGCVGALMLMFSAVRVSAPSALSLQDHAGRTPLHLAAMRGSVPCVDWLLANGAPLAVEDKRGDTSYALANAIGHADVAALLAIRAA